MRCVEERVNGTDYAQRIEQVWEVFHAEGIVFFRFSFFAIRSSKMQSWKCRSITPFESYPKSFGHLPKLKSKNYKISITDEQ